SNRLLLDRRRFCCQRDQHDAGLHADLNVSEVLDSERRELPRTHRRTHRVGARSVALTAISVGRVAAAGSVSRPRLDYSPPPSSGRSNTSCGSTHSVTLGRMPTALARSTSELVPDATV